MSNRKRLFDNTIKSKDLILDSDDDDSDESEVDIVEITISKLESLMDQRQYKEARVLFNEMIKSSLFNANDLWAIGIEIVANTTPESVVDYLRAVHASCPENLKFDTFNAFIDQLMLEEKWESALDEIDLVFQRSTYHHPTILRKLAFCSYYRWKKARKQLPQSYLEGEIEIEDIEQSTIDKYSNCLAFAMEKLSFAHNTLPYDVELLEKYCELLSIMNDHDIKKSVILKSLEAYKKSPNYYLIFFLLEENANNIYFEGEPFIMEMYELDPTLDDKFGLRKVVEMTCAQIDKIIPCGEDVARIATLKKQAIGLFELFVKRIEYGKLDLWYLKQVRDSILTNALSAEICSIYHSKKVDELLKIPSLLSKQINSDRIVNIARQIKCKIEEFEEEKDDSKDRLGRDAAVTFGDIKLFEEYKKRIEST